jgi:hypothetical protein
MRNTIFAILLIMSGTLAPAQAGLLTRGNVFADGLAGCTFGAMVGFVGGMLISAPTPVVGTSAIAAAIPHLTVLGGCLTGAIVTSAINVAIYLSDVSQDLLDQHRPLESMTDMVYPETPLSCNPSCLRNSVPVGDPGIQGGGI